jgi:hypothetical protein
MTRTAVATPDDERLDRQLALPAEDQVAILEHLFTRPAPPDSRRNRFTELEIELNRVHEIRSRLLLVRRHPRTPGGAW